MQNQSPQTWAIKAKTFPFAENKMIKITKQQEEENYLSFKRLTLYNRKIPTQSFTRIPASLFSWEMGKTTS